MVALIIRLLKPPVSPGEAEPRDEHINFDDIVKNLSMCVLNTPYRMRMMEGSSDGILYTMPPPASQKLKRTWVLGSKVVTTAGTAVALVASSTLATRLVMHAKKVAGDNTGNVFWGDSTLDQGVKEGPEVAPGESFEITAQPGECFDLADIYIDSDTDADGFVFNYLPA